MSKGRSELQQEVARAMIESKAINFEAIGGILARNGERAALHGTEIGHVIGRRVIDACIPPEPYAIKDALAGLKTQG